MSAAHLAQVLAGNGLPVFPCAANKRPTCPRGFNAAVTDPAQVLALWHRHPGPLIGVPTGIRSGVDVLDIDPRHGGDEWWRANAHRLPETRTHHTRGGGLHILFRHHEMVLNSESKVAPGVDVRGAGGYAIWWPAHGCRVSNAPVASWPQWLLQKLLGKPKQQRRYAGPLTQLNGADAAHRMATRALDRVAGAAEGQRHYQLRAAAHTIGGLLQILPIGEEEARHRLVAAAAQAGAADLANAERTAAWGLAKGKARPFALAREGR